MPDCADFEPYVANPVSGLSSQCGVTLIDHRATVRPMHLPDGVLPARAWVPLWVAGASALAAALPRLRSSVPAADRGRQIARAGFLAAVVLVLEAVNFPLLGAASSHVTGTALVTFVLGLEGALFVMACVLAMQALLFHDGGVLALGANYVNMAVLPALATLPFVAAVRSPATRSRRRLAYVLAATLTGSAAGAASCAALLAVSGIAPWGTAMPWMVGCHLLVGLIEGALTASALHALRGSLTVSRAHAPSHRRRRVLVPVLALVASAAVLVPLASERPDVLETLLERLRPHTH